MVPYDVDKEVRLKIMFVIALMSILSAPFIQSSLEASSAFIAPSALTVCIGVYIIWDKILWRLFGFNKLIGIPNLNGKWSGIVTNPAPDGSNNIVETNCTLTVTQTWSKINLSLKTEGSISKTLMANISIMNPDRIEIIFAYEVKSKGAKNILNRQHGEGFNSLMITNRNGKKRLDGYYFSNVMYANTQILHIGHVSVEN